MKKSSYKISASFVVCFLVSLFFLVPFFRGRIPIAADSLIGLYHPWRDLKFEGYDPGRFPVKNPQINDPILQGYPWRYLIIKNIKEGNLPLWNPYSFSGQPLLANIQSSPFAIFNLPFLIFPFKFAWTLSVVLPSILISLFMFLFLKSLNMREEAAFFGALVLPFSGFFMPWLTWGTIVATVMWLPLILFCVNKILIGGSIKYFLLMTFSASQIIFSGHWQAAFYSIMAIVVYLLLTFSKFENKKVFFLPVVSLILGIVVSSVAIFPAVEFLNHSARNLDQVYFEGRRDWFLPVENLIQLVAPDFFGNPATYNYWGVWNWWEFVTFVGIVPLGFALSALFSRVKISGKKFFVTLLLISLILAIENPISKIPYVEKIPFFSSVQPSRVILLTIFSLVGLASLGVESFVLNKSKIRYLVSAIFVLTIHVFLILFVLFSKDFWQFSEIDARRVAIRNLILPLVVSFLTVLLIGLRWFRFSSKVIFWFLTILVVIELYRFGYKFTPFSKFSWIFPDTKTTDYLSAQKKPFRIMATDRRIMHPNSSSVYGIESVDGYDPLYLEDYGRLVSSWQNADNFDTNTSFGRIVTPQNYLSNLTNLLNVQYILSLEDISDPRFVKVFEEGLTRIYKNSRSLPRAFFVDEVVRVDSREDELRAIVSNMDLTRTAVSSQFGFSKQENEWLVDTGNYDDQSLSLNVRTAKEAPLFVSTVYYPGWRAYIDDKEVSIKRTNYLFQSVLVPSGDHKVDFRYRPNSFYRGLYISIFGILLTVLVSYLLWKRKFQ